MKINRERLVSQMEQLAVYGAQANGGITRFAFSPEYKQAIQYVQKLMEEAGLATHYDPVGNLIGVLAGEGRHKVLVGSHIDTVKNGGKFDGAIGVIGAIEAVRTIREQKVALKNDIYVCVYLDEEFTALGSKAMVGKPLEKSTMEKLFQNGYTLEDVEKSKLPVSAEDYALELHIEQGKTLESEKISIGVVDAILASYKYAGTVEGHTGHAGTLSMKMRDDAFAKMTDFTSAFYRKVVGYPDMVGTIGQVTVLPGARNIVPGRVEFLAEMRSPYTEDMEAVEDSLRNEYKDKGICLIRTEEYEAAHMHPDLKRIVEQVCEAGEIPYIHMNSGAGHDIQSFYKKAKCALIFIPSVNGASHCPEECTSWEDCEKGVNVLADTIAALG